jgi:hypothetical protein
MRFNLPSGPSIIAAQMRGKDEDQENNRRHYDKGFQQVEKGVTALIHIAVCHDDLTVPYQADQTHDQGGYGQKHTYESHDVFPFSLARPILCMSRWVVVFFLPSPYRKLMVVTFHKGD